MRRMKRIVSILLLAFTATAHGANLFVTPTGAGALNGSDWNNAFAGIPVSSLVRGNTYYVAGGSYLGFEVATATSGATYIYFRKATATDHGTDTGWSPAFGTNAAIFGPINLKTSYLDFNGMAGSGTTGYGFKASITSTNANASTITIFSGILAANNRFQYCDISAMTGGGIDTATSASSCFIAASGELDNLYLGHCYIHNGGATWLSLGNATGVTIEHCVFQTLGSGFGNQHCAGIAASGQQNITIRYNAFIDALFNVTTYIEPQVFCNGFNVYGNTFWGRSASENTSQGALAITGGDGPAMSSVSFFNNTLYGLHILTGGGVWGGNLVGANVVLVTNNVLPTVSGNFPNCSLGSNVDAGGASFVNAAVGDFHLTANTVNGTTLTAPYNTDPDGVTRGLGGHWDIGAYQFAGSSPSAPNSPTNLSPAAGALGVVTNPTLIASTYSDPNASAFTASQFIVYDATGSIVIQDSGVIAPSTFWAIPSALANSSSYQWTVRYQNANGLWSAFSPKTTFTTVNVAPVVGPTTPSNISPADNAQGVSILPTLILSAYSDPNARPQAGAQFIIKDDNKASNVWDSGVIAPTAMVTPTVTLSNSTAYRWNGRYLNNAGAFSAFSPSTRFITAATPQPPLPINGIWNIQSLNASNIWIRRVP